MWRPLVIVAAGVALAWPALAQQQNSELLQRLQATSPDDLAAQAAAALSQYNQMTPEQRAAASAKAQSEVPELIGAATDWWNKLTPEQQAAYQKSVQGLSGAINAK